jgi:redox-sensitive bicupin YhaK (pirin superfamily)
MLEIRPSAERGHADHGWLESFHTFSFAAYHDPKHMGFGPLRVINEDRVIPGAGFATHSHRDMEIVSYVLEGELAHKDSIGTGSVIRPGDVQRMSAGRGVTHSEYNNSHRNGVHFLQIWIIPDVLGGAPSYEQKHFEDAEKRGRLRLIASPDGAEGSLHIQQNARLYAGLFDGTERASLELDSGRSAYAHVARGALTLNGTPLNAGDGLKISGTAGLEFSAGRGAEVLLFDLPG